MAGVQQVRIFRDIRSIPTADWDPYEYFGKNGDRGKYLTSVVCAFDWKFLEINGHCEFRFYGAEEEGCFPTSAESASPASTSAGNGEEARQGRSGWVSRSPDNDVEGQRMAKVESRRAIRLYGAEEEERIPTSAETVATATTSTGNNEEARQGGSDPGLVLPVAEQRS